MDRPTRKPNRLYGYDYSENGAYFITCCAIEKQCIFADRKAPHLLTPWGAMVDQAIQEIPGHYPGVRLERYVVMPNHIHLLLLLINSDVSVSRVVQQLKRTVSRRIGKPVWQKSFHDRIIRNDAEFRKIWTYIDPNVLRWDRDCFYQDERSGPRDPYAAGG